MDFFGVLEFLDTLVQTVLLFIFHNFGWIVLSVLAVLIIYVIVFWVKEVMEERKNRKRKKAEEEKQKREMERQKEEARIERERKEKEEEGLRRKLEEEAKAFDWDYNPDSRTLTISGNGNMPAGWRPWPRNLNVDKVVIKNGVLSISDNAFFNMSVKRIEFGETLLSIGSKIFSSSVGGDVVRFPKSLRDVGNSAFVRFATYKEVIIIFEDKIEKIGEKALGESNHCEVRFKTKNPPIVENGLLFSDSGCCPIKVPKGCYKQYISSPCFAKYVNVIREMDVEEMDLTPEDIRKRDEERRKAEAEKKRLEEEERRKVAEEKRRREEEERQKAIEAEKMKKQEEELLKAKRGREDEERQRVEEEEFRARVEAELREKMGL